MSELFYGCESLVSFPDIPIWNIENVTNKKDMLTICSILKSLPDISKWNTKNITNMNFIFNGCKSYHYLIYQYGTQIMLLI